MPHKLGQVFLHDTNIITKIIQFSGVAKTDHVIEIGCGHGAMTIPIAQQVKRVSVIEIDEACINVTKEKLSDNTGNVMFYADDILSFDLAQHVNQKTKIMGNIPYYISAKIIKKLMTCLAHPFKDAVLMVQKEFAKKCLAKPGDKDYTSLSIYIQNFFQCEYGFTVSKNCFKPVPKVDSAVIKLIPKKEPLIPDLEHPYFKIVNSAFWGRRKPLVSALKKSPHLTLTGDISHTPFLKENPTIRGEKVSAEEFYVVYNEIKCYLH